MRGLWVFGSVYVIEGQANVTQQSLELVAQRTAPGPHRWGIMHVPLSMLFNVSQHMTTHAYMFSIWGTWGPMIGRYECSFSSLTLPRQLSPPDSPTQTNLCCIPEGGEPKRASITTLKFLYPPPPSPPPHTLDLPTQSV
jgi:hypothetical protein